MIDVEKALDTLPDQVADALEAWRVSTLNREKTEAILQATFKMENERPTAIEIKYFLLGNSERYNACIAEIKCEANYNRLYERLMAAKKVASLRVAF